MENNMDINIDHWKCKYVDTHALSYSGMCRCNRRQGKYIDNKEQICRYFKNIVDKIGGKI